MDGQPYQDSINAQLGGLFSSNTAEGAFTTGSFAFTEPELRKVINNWLDLAESYDLSIGKTQAVTSMDGPGLDYASQSFVATANQSGESLTGYLVRNRDYCLEQAQLSQNALDDYLGVEHTNVTEIAKTSQGPRPKI